MEVAASVIERRASLISRQEFDAGIHALLRVRAVMRDTEY